MEKIIHNVETGEVTVVPFTPEEEAVFWERRTPLAWASIREERNRLLSESDISVLPDRWATYTEEKRLEWAAYRQALRDLPQNTTDPFNPVWPVKPT
jgi:hypothetical protein